MKNFKKLTLLMALASVTSFASAGWLWSQPKPQLDLKAAISQFVMASVDTGLGLARNQAQACGQSVLAYMPESFQSQVNMNNLVNTACVASIGLAVGAAQQATANPTVAAAVEKVTAGIQSVSATLDKVSATLDETAQENRVKDKEPVSAADAMNSLNQVLAERVELAMPLDASVVSSKVDTANRKKLAQVFGVVASVAAVVAAVKNPTAVTGAFASAMKFFGRK